MREPDGSERVTGSKNVAIEAAAEIFRSAESATTDIAPEPSRKDGA